MSRSRWCSWFRATRGRHGSFRAAVFVTGLALVVLGATMWLVTSLLAVPPMILGLWVWSREFHWGHRLFHAFLRRSRALWARVKQRPWRWAFLTVVGFATAWAAYWALQNHGPL